MKTFIILSICILLLGQELCSQEYSYVQYTEKDGLASSTVYDICQDKNGFIWFATENGISRFDGTHFKTYTTKNGLPDNAVLKIHADKTGRIWMIPFTHPVHYLQNDTIKPLEIPDRFKSDFSNAIGFYDYMNDIVITTPMHTIFTIKSNGTVESWSEKYKQLPPNSTITSGNDSSIFLSKSDSVFYKAGDSFKYICNVDPKRIPLKYGNNKVEIYAEKIEGKDVFSLNSLSNKIIYGLYNNWVYFFDVGTGKFLYKIKIENFSRAISDHENNLWIATRGNGVFRFPSLSVRQITFNSRSSEVFSIAEFNNKIIVGSDFSKLYLLSRDKNIFTTEDLSKYLKYSGNTPAVVAKWNRLYKLLSFDNELYVGADGFLMKKFPGGRNLIKNLYPIKDIDIAKNELLLSTGTGAYLLNSSDLSLKETLLQQRATAGSIYNNEYFIGTIGGLLKINSKTKNIVYLQEKHKAFAKRITAIQRGINNDLWIATSGAGLVHYKNDSATVYLASDSGISSDICTSLFIDSNEVWLGTVNGLNRIINPYTNSTIIQYTTADGLPSGIINSVFVHNKIVYVGTPKGLTYFDKNTIGEKSGCLLHFLGVTVADSVLKLSNNYSFAYKTLNIRFDFVGVSFKSEGKISYYYQLQGLDEKWNMTTNTFVNFATLPPGTYLFNLKAINKFGVQSEMKSIKITIRKPWWQEWWFITLVLFLVFSFVTWLYHRRINVIKRREKNKRKIQTQFAALEQKALQAQMNPHFIFNCLNSIQSFVINHDVEGASRYISKFAGLIRQTLDNSNSQMISLATEIKYIETYLALEKMRFEDKFIYTLHIDSTIDSKSTFLPGMLLQPYIENAIRHGIQHLNNHNGEIIIRFEKNARQDLVCTISDNGVGRKRSKELKSSQPIEYMSKGIHITQKRIEILNKQYNSDILVDSEDILEKDGLVAGTKFTLTFPKTFYGK